MQLVPPDSRLTGRWTRSLLERADGGRDDTTEVTWLQAAGLYVDLRLPSPWPPTGVQPDCLRALGREQVAALAIAEGFAGGLEADGPWAWWRRAVDLQPAGPGLDQGRLDDIGRRPGEHVVESGRDGSYLEHWHRTPGAAEPGAAVLLADADSPAQAVLVRVGDDVAWARGRTVPLPAGAPTLADLVAGASSLAAAQDLLDAEVSLGRVGEPASRSSLPWRVGRPIGLDLRGGLATTDDTAPDGTAVVRTWQVLLLEGSALDLPTT